jgi:hypothetical protein
LYPYFTAHRSAFKPRRTIPFEMSLWGSQLVLASLDGLISYAAKVHLKER